MKTLKLFCISIIIGAIILKISWLLVIQYHGENTTKKEEMYIAEPIFQGSTIVIIFSTVCLIILWLLPKTKNLSNS